jgi:hypothetical protein
MDQLDQIVAAIALSMGAAWASGINLYAAILVLGWLGLSGNMVLPPDLQVLTSPMVLFAAGTMYVVEFFADKVPGVDSAWDGLHTLIRIPAGAILAASAVGEVDPALSLAAALVGGGLAAATHATKAGSRVLINSSPEPFSNWLVSFSEDVLVVAGLWAALHYPWAFVVFLLFFVIMLIWLLPRVWRGVKWLLDALARFCGGRQPQVPPAGIKLPGVLSHLEDPDRLGKKEK